MDDRTGDAAHPPAPAPERPAFRDALAGLQRSLLDESGTVPPPRRRSVARGDADEGPLGEYLEQVRGEAYKVTDEQVAELRKSGHADDELFELTVCAAFGAAKRRLDAGLAAIAEAYESE